MVLHSGAFINKTEHTYKNIEKHRKKIIQEVEERGVGFQAHSLQKAVLKLIE